MIDLKRLAADLNTEMAAGGFAREAFETLLKRGHTRQSAFELMLRARAYCLHETNFGLSDRWQSVAASIAEGRTVDDLFPDGLYSVPQGPPN
jgi:hypothetical protein